MPKIHGEENVQILNKNRNQVCTFLTWPHLPHPNPSPGSKKIYLQKQAADLFSFNIALKYYVPLSLHGFGGLGGCPLKFCTGEKYLTCLTLVPAPKYRQKMLQNPLKTPKFAHSNIR